MPINKKQLHRLVRFVAQLKENRYPNCNTFAAELREADTSENRNLACTSKTIQRDIKVLKEEFDCPLSFDHEHHGYCLKHHGWDFKCPQLFEEHEMLAAVLGARVAEDIFPEPLKSSIRQSVDFLLAANNPDFLDRAIVKSLTVIPGFRSNIVPGIFMTVFHAWQQHEALDIIYADAKNLESKRRIEPHALVYYQCSWYVKGFCLKRNEVRTFALHRIVDAQKSGLFFEPDDKIISSVLNDHFLEYKEISGIELRCDVEIKSFVTGTPLHRNQQIEPVDNKSFRLLIPAMVEHEILQWVLYQAGKAELVKPASLRSKIRKKAQKIAGNHRADLK